MADKSDVIRKVKNFLESSEKGFLLTGTNQYEKHLMIMALLDKFYRGAKVLFRINAMSNITDDQFLGELGVLKQPKAGKQIQIGHNYYEFDSAFNRGTWNKTSYDFDFAIFYPIDALVREKNYEPIQELFSQKNIGKIFLCTWTDRAEYDYSLLQQFYSQSVAYDKNK